MTGDVVPRRAQVLDEQSTITPGQFKQLLHQVHARGDRAQVRRRVTGANGQVYELEDGGLVEASDHTRYRIENMNRGGFTLRREIPRARGKAARRAEKRARAEARRRARLVVDAR